MGNAKSAQGSYSSVGRCWLAACADSVTKNQFKISAVCCGDSSGKNGQRPARGPDHRRPTLLLDGMRELRLEGFTYGGTAGDAIESKLSRPCSWRASAPAACWRRLFFTFVLLSAINRD
jgi:hypothetical protein